MPYRTFIVHDSAEKLHGKKESYASCAPNNYPSGQHNSARRLNLVNPRLEVDITDLNVQEMSINEPRLTVGNSTSTRRLNLVKPAIEQI